MEQHIIITTKRFIYREPTSRQCAWSCSAWLSKCSVNVLTRTKESENIQRWCAEHPAFECRNGEKQATTRNNNITNNKVKAICGLVPSENTTLTHLPWPRAILIANRGANTYINLTCWLPDARPSTTDTRKQQCKSPCRRHCPTVSWHFCISSKFIILCIIIITFCISEAETFHITCSRVVCFRQVTVMSSE